MTINGFLQIVLFLFLLLLSVKPLGRYMARVYSGEQVFLSRFVGPIERQFYRLAGIQHDQEMQWKTYAVAVLVFNLAGMVLLYLLLRIQGSLPLNPQGVGNVPPDLAFNTAVSFVTNTNWQNYSGEITLSFFSQMVGITVQNFLSAATGMAIAVAIIRGISRQNSRTVGNFWVDVTRGTLYILLPLAIVLALALAALGTVQTLSAHQMITLPQSAGNADGQTIALGPAASQVAIKHLGTNGGGFFNANAAHPYENPTPLTDLILVLSQTVIAAALTYTFGYLVGDTRQGWALLWAMMILLIVFILGAYAAESAGNPRLAPLGIDQVASSTNPGGNMEGKELRFGISRSALFATTTTATSNGAVDSMHDSFTPLGGMVALVLMQLGEVVLGGVGSGLYGILAFVFVAVFVAGLMVGRTPEYLGKKIEVFEMKMSALLILIMPVLVLGLTGLAVATHAGKEAVFNPGPHGFSEILYAFTSQGNNNGSAYAGIMANTPFYNLAGGIAMLISRYWTAIPTLALAGSLAGKKKVPPGAGTLPSHTPLFIGWLVAIILIVGALNFIPALALGPIVEHLSLVAP